MPQPKYQIKVTAAPYSDGSGYAAEATIEPGDDDLPSVQMQVVYRINAAQWAEFKAAIDRAVAMAEESTAVTAA